MLDSMRTFFSLVLILVLPTVACTDSSDGDSTLDAGSTGGNGDAASESDGGVTEPDGSSGETDGSSGDGAVGPTTCPIDAPRKALALEVMNETMSGSFYVATMSHYREAAFALFLPGVEEVNLGVASLAFECMDESFYVPYCDDDGGGITPGGGGEPSSPFWETRTRCGRLGCGGVGVDIQQVYMTMKPHTEPDDRHEFTYESVAPEGMVTYHENPFIEWRITRASMTRWRVTATLDHDIDFALSGGDTVALSHTGTVDIDVDDSHIVTAEIHLAFPDLSPAAPVDASIELDATDALSGQLEHGGTALGEWSGTLMEPTFTWLGRCAD